MHRLLPLLAAAYGFQFTGQAMAGRLAKLEREVVHGEPAAAFFGRKTSASSDGLVGIYHLLLQSASAKRSFSSQRTVEMTW